MAKKETAFTSSISYRELAQIGRKLAQSKNTKEIASYLRDMKSDDVIAVQRSAAVIANASDIDTELFKDFIADFIQIIERNAHRSAPRTIFRILEKLDHIPEDSLGPVVDISFRYLNDPKKSIAEKVFAMTVIANQLNRFPELKYELEASLSAQFHTGSAGFKSRANNIAAKYDLKLRI